jgi:hypothetical protein
MGQTSEQFNESSQKVDKDKLFRASFTLMFADTRKGFSPEAKAAYDILREHNEDKPDARRKAVLDNLAKNAGIAPQNKMQPAV